MQRLRLKPLLEPGDICHAAVTTLADPGPARLHGHDFMEIFLILDGAGWHFINGKKIALKKGDAVLVRQQDGHGFTVRAGESMRLLNVAFPCSWFARLRALLPRPEAIARWLRGALPPSVCLSGAGRDSLEQRGLDLMSARGPRHVELAQFCLEAVRLLESRAEIQAGLVPPEWLTPWLALMDQPENLSRPLAWFQEHAGRSPEHLARLCRRCLGAPPTELLNRARIRHAKRRLIENDAKIIDVALDCGFQNLGYFHRTFLRLAGTTPRHWRLKNLALTAPR